MVDLLVPTLLLLGFLSIVLNTLVGGGAGTFIEACVAYQKGKPIVALTGTGGTADKIADTYLDDRKTVKVLSASSPKDAVDQALELVSNGKKGVRYFQNVARMI